MSGAARSARRGIAPARLAVLVVVALIAALGVTWWASRPPPAPPTEDEQLAAFRDSLEYASYRATSSAALPLLIPGDVAFPALQRWVGSVAENSGDGADASTGAGAMTPRQTCLARVALAFHALGESRNRAALAEADLTLAAPGCGTLEQHLAAGVQAVVFDRQRWPTLAERQVGYLTLAPSATGVGDARTEVMTAHVALAVLALRERRPLDFQLHADAAGLIGRLPWLDRVTAVAVDAELGRLPQTREGLQRLAGDFALPEDVRAEAAALAVELSAAPADEGAAAPGDDAATREAALASVAERLFAQVLWSQTKAQAGATWDELLRRAGEIDPWAWLRGPAPPP